jgi:hypothetical protein
MYQIFNRSVVSDLALPELETRPADEALPRIAVTRYTDEFPASLDWVHHWRNEKDEIDISLSFIDLEGQSQYLLRFPETADFLVNREGNLIRYRPFTDVPDNTVRHLLLDQVIPRTLGQQGDLVLHASSVHLPGAGAILFVAPSGSGKSTLAASFVESGADLISDDCIMVLLSQPATAIASYDGLRLFPDSIAATKGSTGQKVSHYSDKRRFQPTGSWQRNQSIVAVFLLGQSTEIKVTATRAAKDLMTLINQTFLLDVTDKNLIKTQFSNLTRFIDRLPLFSVHYPHDHARLPEVVRAIRCAATQPEL